MHFQKKRQEHCIYDKQLARPEGPAFVKRIKAVRNLALQIWKTIVLFAGKSQENTQQNGEKKET